MVGGYGGPACRGSDVRLVTAIVKNNQTGGVTTYTGIGDLPDMSRTHFKSLNYGHLPASKDGGLHSQDDILSKLHYTSLALQIQSISRPLFPDTVQQRSVRRIHDMMVYAAAAGKAFLSQPLWDRVTSTKAAVVPMMDQAAKGPMRRERVRRDR